MLGRRIKEHWHGADGSCCLQARCVAIPVDFYAKAPSSSAMMNSIGKLAQNYFIFFCYCLNGSGFARQRDYLVLNLSNLVLKLNFVR